MTEPRWLSAVHVLHIHSDQVQAHGGSLGLRDRALLESALERPRNRFHYEPDADLAAVAAVAAAYGFGISSNHPFIDGNKRVAFQAMYLFLGLNGFRIDAPEEEVVALVLSLANGALDEPSLADWLREYLSPR
ncbi:MAG: type II toxin-antitoxin system death-on-curing family toxin [Longimicrobiales bacterium]